MSQQQPTNPTAAETASKAWFPVTFIKDCVVFKGDGSPITASGNSFGSKVSKIKARLGSFKFVDTTFFNGLWIDIPLGIDSENRGFDKVIIKVNLKTGEKVAKAGEAKEAKKEPKEELKEEPKEAPKEELQAETGSDA
ncbi:hypothetical protein CSUB01_07194 [Colletotrichum sublineola]|uniref:Uncharacterized protein n=1 Tax=Colletotrichum sublineola TaxID=1173701 RepID=A0A066XTS7_COLSU|nr:hypothetical protein CSUB01_07194 [Colletotrichum sublineola]